MSKGVTLKKNNKIGIINKLRKQSKIRRKYKTEKFNFVINTKERRWKYNLHQQLSELEIDDSLKKHIRKDLKRNFYQFVKYHTDKENYSYKNYLVNRNKNLTKVSYSDMVQSPIVNETKKAKSYEVIGSGNAGVFCITGEKTLIGKSKKVYRSQIIKGHDKHKSIQIPRQLNYYSVKLHLSINMREINAK